MDIERRLRDLGAEKTGAELCSEFGDVRTCDFVRFDGQSRTDSIAETPAGWETNLHFPVDSEDELETIVELSGLRDLCPQTPQTYLVDRGGRRDSGHFQCSGISSTEDLLDAIERSGEVYSEVV